LGRRQRLSDSLSFNEEMKRAIFADEAEVFRYNVKMKRALDLDDAEFDRWLADMNIETALQVADVDKAAAATSATISGVGQTVVAGVSAYEKYTPSTTTTPTSGTDEGSRKDFHLGVTPMKPLDWSNYGGNN
jgi:hypothetical protein